MTTDTIVAQATAPGRGGVGIIRVSGPLATKVASEITGKDLRPRYAEYLAFKAQDGTEIDQGIALYFPNPHSFTGEDVLELQGHGGPVVMDMLIKRILTIPGLRTARPGEFSERAFLNDKLDLAQAEAIADLIDASSEEAAKSALMSLQGAFSGRIHTLVESLIHLRIYVEAAIDFPEEEIDFLADGKVATDLQTIIDNLAAVRQEANQGAIMREERRKKGRRRRRERRRERRGKEEEKKKKKRKKKRGAHAPTQTKQETHKKPQQPTTPTHTTARHDTNRKRERATETRETK